MPRLSHSETFLTKAVKEMQLHWNLTSSAWKDKARADFQKTYLDELIPAVRSVITSTGRVNQLLEEAIRKCS